MNAASPSSLNWRVILPAAVLLVELAGLSMFAYEFDSFFQYAAADRLLQGQTMYRDFAYQQWPLLPFLYAAVFSVTGVSLMAGRLIGLAGGIATVVVSAALIRRLTKRFGGEQSSDLGVEALLWLHAACFVPACFLVLYDTKTYLVSLLMIALLYIGAGDRPSRGIGAGLVAAMLGLIKMTYAPIGAMFLASQLLLRRYQPRQVIGFAAAYLLPIAALVGYYMIVAPAHFRYQTYEALISSKQAGFDTSEWLFGYLHIGSFVEGTIAVVGGYLALPLLSLLGLPAPARDDGGWKATALFGAGLAVWMYVVSAILPGRGNAPHYFAPFVPVALVFAAWGLQQSGVMARLRAQPPIAVLAAPAVLFALNLNLIHSLGTYAPRPIHLRRMLAQYDEARAIDQYTAPGAIGLGYGRYPHALLLSSRDFVTGNETTVHWMAAPIPTDEAQRFHIMTKDRWRDLIGNRRADFLLIDDDDVAAMAKELDLPADLGSLGYRRAFRDGFTGLYVRDGHTAAAPMKDTP